MRAGIVQTLESDCAACKLKHGSVLARMRFVKPTALQNILRTAFIRHTLTDIYSVLAKPIMQIEIAVVMIIPLWRFRLFQ